MGSSLQLHDDRPCILNPEPVVSFGQCAACQPLFAYLEPLALTSYWEAPSPRNCHNGENGFNRNLRSRAAEQGPSNSIGPPGEHRDLRAPGVTLKSLISNSRWNAQKFSPDSIPDDLPSITASCPLQASQNQL